MYHPWHPTRQASGSSDPVRSRAKPVSRARAGPGRSRLVVWNIPATSSTTTRKPFSSHAPNVRGDTTHSTRSRARLSARYVRWTENRKPARILAAARHGPRRVPVNYPQPHHCGSAGRLRADSQESAHEYFLGVLSIYRTTPDLTTARRMKGRGERRGATGQAARGEIQLGVIGPGSFARATLCCPRSESCRGSRVARSARRRAAARGRLKLARSGAAYCTSDYLEILRDDKIDTVLIATRIPCTPDCDGSRSPRASMSL